MPTMKEYIRKRAPELHSHTILRRQHAQREWQEQLNGRVQRTAAQGTCESEYDAMAQCTKALIYVKSVLEEWVGLFISCGRLSLHGDNMAALDVSSDEGTKKRTKHFERNLHYVRDYVVAGEIFLR